MKLIKLIFLFAITSVLVSSCNDQVMEWGKDPSHGDITEDELPLGLEEKIARYDVLNSYTDFTLGVGIGLTLYMEDETYRTIANENFDEVTVGYNMKHGPMVEADGSIDFESVDPFIQKTKEAGLSVYGHTLVWHSNQNASYLNGLIAPTVIPGSGGTNLLSNGDFNEGLDGWSYWGSGEFSQVGADEALEGDGAFKIVNTNDVASEQWKTQAQIKFPYIWETGNTYSITIYARSEAAGSFRLSTTNEEQGNYTDVHYLADETTGASYQVYSYEIEAQGFESGLSIDIGGKAGTYFIDKIEVIDKDAPVEAQNLISNGTFEDGTLTGWGGWGNGSTRDVSAQGEGFGGTGYAMVLGNPVAANIWEAQQVYVLDAALEQGKEYTCTFMVKADVTATLQVQIQNDSYAGDYYGGISVGAAWSQVSLKITPSTADKTKFVFDFGESVATYYIDDVVLTDGEGGSSGPTIIEKTDEEKTEIIRAALVDWISQMGTHYKNDVFAWDVVNEPMKGNGDLRDGTDDHMEGEEPDDYFSWVRYLGKDYAVTAFNLARQYGNPTDVLFINDYNLEYSPAKLDGLLEYVKYIDSQGALVDGIGTQMHISYTSDSASIIQMFQKLGASGKKIKISELDVRLGTKDPTPEQLEQQADMYRFVMEMYQEHIPVENQYGVTIWGISDNTQEHEYWLPDESPNLWDADYQRKHAYKGAADGLAGYDVSDDFPGGLPE